MRSSVWLATLLCLPLVLALAMPLMAWLIYRHRQRASAAQLEGRILRQQLFTSQKFEIFGSLVAGLIHDMRNVHMVVSGSLDLALLNPTLPPEVRETLQRAKQVNDHGHDVMAKILSTSRQGAGTEPTDVLAALQELEPVIRLLLPKSVRYEAICFAKGLRIRADRSVLFQVVMNLLVNARDALGDGPGSVTVIVAEGSEVVEVSVQDTGCGIPPAILHRIFTPLFTTKPAGRGTGLGLGIVRDGVESMGGTVRVESRVGEGTTFTLTFPRVA